MKLKPIKCPKCKQSYSFVEIGLSCTDELTWAYIDGAYKPISRVTDSGFGYSLECASCGEMMSQKMYDKFKERIISSTEEIDEIILLLKSDKTEKAIKKLEELTI